MVGDTRELIRDIPEASVHCVVTSPPYYKMRNYQHAKQIGNEATDALYVAAILECAREWRRVLRPEGTLWLNLGDCYSNERVGKRLSTLPPKNLLMLPARIALALQADGWMLRKKIVWYKPNCLSESVKDRPTSSHEEIYLFAKGARNFFDYAAVLEPFADARMGRDGSTAKPMRNRGGRTDGLTKPNGIDPSGNGGRRMRDVWIIPTRPSGLPHFATFPPEIPLRCIKAGTSEFGCCPACGAPWERIVKRRYGLRL